jgi:uncharacterized repeat protein (TIGR01451 family)
MPNISILKRFLSTTILVVLFSLVVITFAFPSITIEKPPNKTISDKTPEVVVFFTELVNVTYSWDTRGNISGCINCTSFNTTYGELTPDSNTVLLYHFNENLGSIVYDDSPYFNNGILGNSSQGDVYEPTWVDGKYGKALNFYCTDCTRYGDGKYIEVPYSPDFNITTNLTIFAWIKNNCPDDDNYYHPILESYNDKYALYVFGGYLSFYVTTDGPPWWAEVGGKHYIGNTQEWLCVAATYDKQYLRLYLNGEEEANFSLSTPLKSTTSSLRIGGNSGDGYFNGTIDELALYNRTLTKEEIQYLCNKTLPEGRHNLTIYAINNTNNVTSIIRYFTVDTESPYKIDLIKPLNNSYLTTPINFSWISYDVTSNITSNLTIDDTVKATSDSASGQQVNVSLNLQEGSHNWSVTSWDAAGNKNTSETLYFTVDFTSPQYLLFNNTPLSPYDNESVVCYSNWTDNIELSYGVVEENSTGAFRNHTVNLSGMEGWVSHTINAEDLEAGTVECRIYAYDMAGNLNATPVWSFKVKDTTPPIIANITYSPNTADSLDPGVEVNVSANVADAAGIDKVLLQYKRADEDSWHNYTMGKSGDVYKGNFTPSKGNWSFRVWANDTHGNVNMSELIALEVEYDWTWNRSPVSFGVVSGVIGTNITLTEISIDNIGDFDLNFSLSSNQDWVYYNISNTSNIFVSNHSSIAIAINASVPIIEEERDYSIIINISALNANATPLYKTVEGTLVAYSSGPYLYVTIDAYDPSVTQGDSNINLTATVTNMGNDTATNVWLAWQLPAGWTNTSGTLNKTKSILLPKIEGSKYSLTNTITVSVGSSAPTGAHTLWAIAGCSEKNETNTSVPVVVNAKPSPAPSYDGGLPPAPPPVRVVEVAPPTYAPTPEQRAVLLESADMIEVVRGGTATFTIKIANPFPNSTLENITITIEGYLEGYLEVTSLPRGETATVALAEATETTPIAYNETQIFEVTITAPSYLEKGIYPLNITLQGKIVYHDYPTLINETTGEAINTTDYTLDMKETKTISLIVHTVSREEGRAGVVLAETAIGRMESAGFPTRRLSRLIEEARRAFSQGDYEKAKELGDKIVGIKDMAFATRDMIEELKKSIWEAEIERGLKVIKTKELLDLAVAAFEREDYATAQQRVKDARMVYSLETKGKINYVKILFDYWWAFLTALVILAVGAIMGYNRYSLIKIDRKLENLNAEEQNIARLIKETQNKYYVDRVMSRTSYTEAMNAYQKRLAEIKRDRAALRNRRAGIISMSEELESLKKENQNLKEILRDTQERYYKYGAMRSDEYHSLMEIFWERRAEVEEAIAILEAKLAKERRKSQ